jgi:hypothetical protein
MGIASFLPGHFKVIQAVTPGNDEQMILTHGRGVLDGENRFVLKDN